MQEPRHHITIEQNLRQPQRRPGEYVEKARDQEEREVLQIVHMDAPNALNVLVVL